MAVSARTRQRWSAGGLLLALLGAMLAGLLPTPLATAVGAQSMGALPPLPRNWPGTLQLGLFDGADGAAAMKADTSYGFRYVYLAGGVNTNGGWATWNADGRFATYWIEDSIRHGIIPVFTYYMLVQSQPGNGSGDTAGANFANLQNTDTMAAYYRDLKLLMQRAGEFPNQPVVVHVEPDLWGFMQRRATNDDASTVPAQVSSTGIPELAGLPDDLTGFARAAAVLRDAYAPNVLLAYHLSVWGTGNDIQYSNPPDSEVEALATRAGTFYRSLRTDFDVSFAEFSDRDAGFKQYVYGDGGSSWWDAGDFARHVAFLDRFVNVTQKRVAMWQIPFGNTKMRAMNNTWNHYQDNRVEWLLDDPGRTHLQEYARAGVVALMFGRGAGGTTCPCDDSGDGVTNPEPINGNNALSLNADDDGGFFRQKAQAYYASGPLSLPSGSGGGTLNRPPATATATPRPAATATLAPPATATPLRLATATMVPVATWAAATEATATPLRFATATRSPVGTVTATPRTTTTATGPPSGAATATPRTTPTASPAPLATATPPASGAPSFSTSAAISPASVAAGATARLDIAVRSATSTRALVDVEVYGPRGTLALQQYFDDQSFGAGETRTFPVSWQVPAAADRGIYVVKIGVFAPDWSTLYSWNDAAGQLSVADAVPAPTNTALPTATPVPTATATATPLPTATPTPTLQPSPTATALGAPSFSTTGGARPAVVAPGRAVTTSVRVTSPTGGRALIDVEIYGPGWVRVFQAYYDDEHFSAGQTRRFDASWTAPADAPQGTYTVMAGVFAPGWGTLYSWNSNVAQFQVLP